MIFYVCDIPKSLPPPPQMQVGDTALMIASSNGHSGVVRKLLQAGATVSLTNKVSGIV